MSSTNADLYDLTIQSHLIVESFLLSQNYTCTASALRSEALCSGLCLASLRSSSSTLDPALDLRHLVESYNSTLRAKQGLEKASQLASTYSTSTTVDPLSLPLPGPSTLAFKLERTHSALHASNTLSISKLLLLRRRFDTSSARYVNRLKETLVTSGADRRIVFSDPKTGEIEEILEDGKEGHQAAVLSVAQDPSDVRCVVSSGMDARVVVWDVVRRRVVQVLREHGRFVVKVAFSGSGEYLASIGYDKKVVVYRRTKRTAFAASQGEQEEKEEKEEKEEQEEKEEKEEQEEQEQEELQGERYVKVWEKETQTNPESILFIRASPSPPTDEDEQGIVQRGGAEKGEVVVREAKQKRTWLYYTVRNDSFIHYLSLPLSADCDTAPDLYTTATAITPTPDWTVVSLNTNPNALDLHVSYSLLSLSLHPSGLYICIQTGDQTGPTWRASTSSNTAGSLSRLLLLPLLSGKRATTVWTGVATSSYAVPRHSWLPSGRAVWLNGEDGIVSLVDVKGRIRARVAAHGIASSPDRGERQAATSWTRGGNTIVKDLVVLGEGEVASCGFDRTVRVVAIDSGVLA